MNRPIRYELTDRQWEQLPGKVGDPGRSAVDNRLFVNAVLWVLRSGARWSALPERYGKYKSVHKRFTRWAAAGVWDKVFALLVKDKGNAHVLIDSTIVRAHQQAVTGKGGSPMRLWGVVEGG
jgi:transposase